MDPIFHKRYIAKKAPILKRYNERYNMSKRYNKILYLLGKGTMILKRYNMKRYKISLRYNEMIVPSKRYNGKRYNECKRYKTIIVPWLKRYNCSIIRIKMTTTVRCKWLKKRLKMAKVSPMMAMSMFSKWIHMKKLRNSSSWS